MEEKKSSAYREGIHAPSPEPPMPVRREDIPPSGDPKVIVHDPEKKDEMDNNDRVRISRI